MPPAPPPALSKAMAVGGLEREGRGRKRWRLERRRGRRKEEDRRWSSGVVLVLGF
jgi:hypothetical protein